MSETPITSINPDSYPSYLANPTLELIEQRSSTRLFSDEPVSVEERQAIVHAATRAPSAGAMMFYSIVAVDDPTEREKLCKLCDDQPFMLAAPLWLLFVADNRKWLDLYDQTGCYDDPALPSVPEYAQRRPGLGDLLLAAEDTVAAAQTAVLAAESLGIRSCYIGDVLENGEGVAELLDLPDGTVPLSLVVFGHKKKVRPQTPHPVSGIYMEDHYRLPTAEERAAAIEELDAKFTPHAKETGVRVRGLYHRKHTSDFMAEMNRSAAWWVERWCSAE